MRLSNNQRRDLRTALMAAFPSQPQLELMVEDELDEDLNRITQGQPNYELAVRDLVTWADSQGRLRELVIGALWSILGNPGLGDFVQRNLGLPLQVHAFLDLLRLLSPIDASILREAYRKCLSGRSPGISETRAALIARLADIPGEPDEPKPLVHFVRLLSQDRSLAVDQQQTLRTWAQSQGLSSATATSASETVETYLMVKVQPRSVNDASLGYLVSAAIIRDPDPFNPRAELIATSITIPGGTDPKYAPGYGQEELPHVLSKLIAICGGTLHRIPLTNLTVQWFLPIELLSLPVEHWRIRIGRNQNPCNGSLCKVVMVRPYDRHFLPYADYYEPVVGEWENAWRRVFDSLGGHCDQVLYDLMAEQAVIAREDPERVGCYFSRCVEQSQQEYLLDKVLSKGWPIALWVRHAGTNPQTAMAIMQSVKDCSIFELPISLTSQRQEALSTVVEPDRLEAAPLALLWDNPFRPFPKIDYH